MGSCCQSIHLLGCSDTDLVPLDVAITGGEFMGSFCSLTMQNEALQGG